MSAASPPLAAIGAEPPSRSLLAHPALPWLLAGIGVFACYGSGDLVAALKGLRLPDTDDAMRLAEVRDLVAGQSWFDMVQHRFLPPAGVASHWSRLVDAPLAGAIAGLTPLVGTSLAERIVTAFWPPLLFLTYILVLVRGVAVSFPGRTALLAIFAATQTVGLRIQVTPGRIDHHNLQMILLLGTGFCLMRPARTWHTGALAGFLCACSMAVGLEALPLIALAGLIVAFDWLRAGRPALPMLLGFGLSLGGGATLLFALQTAPSLWGSTACDALSPPWLWLAGTGAAVALAALALQPASPGGRLTLAAATGAAGVAGFALLFPACLHGPFPDMPDLVRTRWLERVHEMLPLMTMLRESPAEGLGLTAPLFVGSAVSLALAIREPAHRRFFLVSGLFLTAGAIQSCFQLRGIYVASALVPLIAGLCLDRAFTAAGRADMAAAPRIALIAGAFALNAQAWMLPGQLAERIAAGGQTEKAKGNPVDTCSEPAAFERLAGLPVGVVLAPIDFGPYLLVHTPHAIVAAPYHRAIAGLTAGIAVAEGSEDALRLQAGATGATYLVLCASPDAEGFAGRLGRGETKADWLDPIPLVGSPLKAWRVH